MYCLQTDERMVFRRRLTIMLFESNLILIINYDLKHFALSGVPHCKNWDSIKGCVVDQVQNDTSRC